MHAAFAADARRGGGGPCPDRRSPGTCSPSTRPDHTRLRRLVSGAFSPRRIEGLRSAHPDIVDDLLDDIAADGPDTRVDLVARFAFPLPFTVICELLGVPEPDRAALGRGLTALLVPTPTPEQYAGPSGPRTPSSSMLDELVETSTTRPATTSSAP